MRISRKITTEDFNVGQNFKIERYEIDTDTQGYYIEIHYDLTDGSLKGIILFNGSEWINFRGECLPFYRTRKTTDQKDLHSISVYRWFMRNKKLERLLK